MPRSDRVGEPIEALLQEGRKFPPSKEFAKRAFVKTRSVYKEAKRNPLRFWERQAKELGLPHAGLLVGSISIRAITSGGRAAADR